jgi:hypothetical protein
MPTRVLIPESIGIKRVPRSNFRHVDGNLLDEADLSQYDSYTLFYDVFFNIDNNYLYLLGPPLLNLRQELLPLRARLNGMEIALSAREFFKKRYVEVRGEVDPEHVRSINRVELDFNGVFDVVLHIERNQQERHSRILSTLQKNNRPRWIKEWIQYYRKYFHIEAVVLYDNGSDDIQALRKELDGVIIEDWDYPFGIVKSHPNKFCQYGSLNHCRLKYGGGARIFNFDIDEILCVDSGWLDRQLKKFDVVTFDSYQVPFLDCGSDDYSFGTFSKRYRVSRRGGKKYIYRDSAVIANNVHFVRTVENEYLNKVQRELVRLFRRMKDKGTLANLATFLSETISKTREARLNEGYFLHYGGITTNWKGAYQDRLKEESGADDFVEIDSACLEKIQNVSRPE